MGLGREIETKKAQFSLKQEKVSSMNVNSIYELE
jgi:hypothetical protein